MSPGVLCLHCWAEETQPLRTEGLGLRLQSSANKNTGCLVVSGKQ